MHPPIINPKSQPLLTKVLPGLMLCVLLSVNTGAQIKDSLQNVQVNDRRNPSNDNKLNHYAPGQKIISFDSATLMQYRQQSLAVLLAQQANVFVKSYGFNSLSTLNFRGSSAAQSQVLWEGIPLQNAASGIADVSLLPVSLMDKISIVYGSSAALWGSGNVGGALLLSENVLSFDSSHSSITISGGVGSFHQYQAGLKASWNNKKWSFDIHSFGQKATNDFSYKNDSGRNIATENAQLKSGSILARLGFKANERNIFSLSAWVQQYDREIPPALFESVSVKNQQDASKRFLLDWNHLLPKGKLYLKTAFLQDKLNYEDSASRIFSKATTNHFFAEAGWETSFDERQHLMIFVPVQYLSFSAAEQKNQTRVALAAAYSVHLLQNKLHVALNARGETVNEKTFLLPGINAGFSVFRWLKIQGNFQRTYRVPTLNELYYFPGGNPDLKPEQGWNEDGGYAIKINTTKKLKIEHNLSAFNRNIQDWIIWFGGNIWTPHNIASVHSRGIETENKLNLQTGKWFWHLSVNASYTLATTTKSYLANDNSIGKQIPYSPRYSGQLNAGFSWQAFYLNYNQTYTGYRYITTDESEYLQPYQTGNLQISWSSGIANHPLTISAQCQNIWNDNYQVVGFRPMPGRNYLVGFSLTFP